MKNFHAYFSSASVLLFLGSSFFFEGTEDIVVYVFSPMWSFINNRRSQETYHLVFFFQDKKAKTMQNITLHWEQRSSVGNNNKVQAVLSSGNWEGNWKWGGTSDPHLFALIPRNQNQLLKGLNCVNLTVRGRYQPKASENTFSLSPLMVCTHEVTYRCGHYQSICCYYNNTWKKSGIPKKEHFLFWRYCKEFWYQDHFGLLIILELPQRSLYK